MELSNGAVFLDNVILELRLGQIFTRFLDRYGRLQSAQPLGPARAPTLNSDIDIVLRSE